MSLAQNRPRVVVNGTRRTRTFHYYWCQNCQRTTRFRSTDPSELFCPHCSTQLYLELDISRPRLASFFPGRVESSPTPSGRRLDSWAQVLDTPDNHGHNLHSWISLHFDEPTPPPAPPPIIEYPMQDLQPSAGPTTTPVSAIEALKRVRISENTRLMGNNEVQCCPICKEEFRVHDDFDDDSDEVMIMELPCKHLYHSDCIVPWLSLYSTTCPVCRYELKDSIISSGGGNIINDHHHDEPQDDGDGENNNYVNTNQYYDNNNYRFEEELANNIELWWNHLMGLRPFRAISEWAHRHFHVMDSRVNNGNYNASPGSQFQFLLHILFFIFLFFSIPNVRIP